MKDIIRIDAAHNDFNKEVAQNVPIFESAVSEHICKGIRQLVVSLDSPKLTKRDKMDVRRALCIARSEYPGAYRKVIEAYGRPINL